MGRLLEQVPTDKVILKQQLAIISYGYSSHTLHPVVRYLGLLTADQFKSIICTKIQIQNTAKTEKAMTE
jgi:hypothetical protein